MKEEIYESWPEEEQDDCTERGKISTPNQISSTTQQKFGNNRVGRNRNASDVIVEDKVLTQDLFESFHGKLYSIYHHVFNGAVKEDAIMKIERLQNELSVFEEDVKTYSASNRGNDESVIGLILNKIQDLKAELHDMKLNHPGYYSSPTKFSLLKKQLNDILSYVNDDAAAIHQNIATNFHAGNDIDDTVIENQIFHLETLLGISKNCVCTEESNLLYQKQSTYPMLESINRIETKFLKLGKNPSVTQNIGNKLAALKTSLEGVINSHTRSSSMQNNNDFDIVEAATKINAIYKKYEKVNHLSNDLNVVASRLESVAKLKALSVDINSRIGLMRTKITDVKNHIKSNDVDLNQVKQQFSAYMNDFHENVYKVIENDVNKYNKL